MEFQANHDALTGLPNRNMLHDRIGQAITYARRVSGRLAVLYFDLDHFKPINDNFGHQTGDELLIAMSARVKAIIREEDTLARLGGDEFVLLMRNIAQETDAAVVAQKLLHALSQPFALAGQQLLIGASVGISVFPEDGDSSELMLTNADAAMYRAKTKGRNNFCFYSQEMSQQTQGRAVLGLALRRALEQQQFELYYQPKVNIANSQVIGVEALIRWHHPDLGIVLPSDFISVAEENGLIAPLGEWVLSTACAQAKAWQAAGLPEITMAVSISTRQFRQQRLPELARRILSETGLDAQRLELALTESLFMQNSNAVIEALREIKALGISLSLDDFGIGISSLNYLKRFPIDIVKINQSLITAIDAVPPDPSMAKAIITMAHSLELPVVAKGVETQAQLNFLLAHRCDAAQGHLLSQPLPATEIEVLLHERF